MIHHLHITPSARPNKCHHNAYHTFSPFPHPPTLQQPSVCSLYFRVSYVLPPSLSVSIFFLSPPPWSSVQFLKIQI